VDPDLKTGVLGLKNSADGGTQHGIEGIISEFLFNYIQIHLFLKNHHYWKD